MIIARGISVAASVCALLLVSASCSDGGTCPCCQLTPLHHDGPPFVRLVTQESDYAVGETITVEVAIDEAENVDSVIFNLQFNENVIEYVPPAVEGPFMGSDGVDTGFQVNELSIGGELSARVWRLQADVGMDGGGLLMSFDFLALSPGACDFRIRSARVETPSDRELPANFASVSVSVI
jgi:hypothetical protein